MWFKKTYQIKVNRTADLKAQQNNFEYYCLKLQFIFFNKFYLAKLSQIYRNYIGRKLKCRCLDVDCSMIKCLFCSYFL